MLKTDTHNLAEQAQVLIRAGDFSKAKVIYDQICRLDQGDETAWMMLGAIHGQLGDLARSVSCLRQAIALRPDYPEAHYNLGYILRGQGDLQEAIAHFEQAAAAKPDYFDAWINMGVINGILGAYDKAEACCRKAEALRPGSLDALMNLGNALLHQDKIREAAVVFQRVLQVKPDFPEAIVALGSVFRANGNHEAAVAQCQYALTLKPNFFEAYLGLGKSLLPLGKPDEAWANCERALQIKPGSADVIVMMSNIAEHTGDVNKAYHVLLPLIDAGSDNVHVALAFARASKELGCQKESITHMEKVLATNPTMSVSGRRNLHFNLGKLYDSAREYDQAFTHYQQANVAKRWEFDAQRHRADADQFIAFQSPEFMSGMPRASIRSDRPIFVVGMMRSGTTLTEQILSSHPAVFGAGELPDIVQMANSLPAMLNTDMPYPQCLSLLTQEKLNELAQTYLDHLAVFSTDALRVVDKAPVNFRHLGLIELMFPNAHVIHCMRDPRDSCLSMYFTDFVHSHDYSFDLSNLGSFYRDYRRVMRHWRDTLKIPLLEVQYEEMVADPEVMIRRVIAFCGLEWDDRCLNFHKSKRYVNTPSYDQVRKPIYRKSAGRWKNYERHIGPLIEALGDEIQA